METFNDDPFEPSSFGKLVGDVNYLMEEGWFFGKLPNREPEMILRCNSDPISRFDEDSKRSNSSPPISSQILCTVKFEGELVRSPSLPPPCEHKEDEKAKQAKLRVLVKIEQPEQRYVHLDRRSNMAGLRRAPSLPPHFGRSDDEDDEEADEISMSRLIRQASSLVSSPSRNGKSVAQIPRYRPPRGSRTAPAKSHPGDRQPNVSGALRKTLSNLENQRAAALLPDLQWRGQINERDQFMVRKRPEFCESLDVITPAATPFSTLVRKNSDQDMKTQLKFWARAVASDVR